MVRWIFLLALVAVSAALVSAAPTPVAEDGSGETSVGGNNRQGHALTNAQRFAAGLPPAKPKRLLNPTKVQRSATSASASPSPGVAMPGKRKRSYGGLETGIIGILDDKDGSTIGYLSRTLTPQGHYLLSTTAAMALEVSFRSDRVHQFNLRSIAPQDEDMPYVGAITANTNHVPVERLARGSPNYALVGLTSKTSRGPKSKDVSQFPATLQRAASPIWNYDPSTQVLSPRWTNPEESLLSSTRLVYLPRNGTLGLVGDLLMHQSLYGDQARVVNFKFLPNAQFPAW